MYPPQRLFFVLTLICTIFVIGCRKKDNSSPPPQLPKEATLSHVRTDNLSEARYGLAAVGAGSKVFFAGGVTETSSSGKVDIYDVVTDKWTVSNLSVPRADLSATTNGNLVFFA